MSERFGIIENGKISNIVTAMSLGDVVAPQGATVISVDEAVAIGDGVNGAVITPKPPTAIPTELLPRTIKAECKRRIVAIVDPEAQINLAAAAAGGLLSTDQMTVYRAGLVWIASTRTVCGTLITNTDQTFASNSHWPIPDQSIVDLGAEF